MKTRTRVSSRKCNSRKFTLGRFFPNRMSLLRNCQSSWASGTFLGSKWSGAVLNVLVSLGIGDVLLQTYMVSLLTFCGDWFFERIWSELCKFMQICFEAGSLSEQTWGFRLVSFSESGIRPSSFWCLHFWLSQCLHLLRRRMHFQRDSSFAQQTLARLVDIPKGECFS